MMHFETRQSISLERKLGRTAACDTSRQHVTEKCQKNWPFDLTADSSVDNTRTHHKRKSMRSLTELPPRMQASKEVYRHEGSPPWSERKAYLSKQTLFIQQHGGGGVCWWRWWWQSWRFNQYTPKFTVRFARPNWWRRYNSGFSVPLAMSHGSVSFRYPTTSKSQRLFII